MVGTNQRALAVQGTNTQPFVAAAIPLDSYPHWKVDSFWFTRPTPRRTSHRPSPNHDPFLDVRRLSARPVALVTVARGKWYVVALGFNDVDPTFDRIAEAETFDGIKQRRRELERSVP